MLYIQLAILVFVMLGMPVLLLLPLFSNKFQSKFQWLLQAVNSAVYLLFIFVVGRWDVVSYFLRYLPLIAFAGVVVITYRRVAGLPFFSYPRGEWWKRHAEKWIEMLFGLALLGFGLRGLFFPAPAVELRFPLQDGRYFVGQGGSSVILNYHNASRSQRYALDIVELNGLGLRAAGIFPTTLESYQIYGDPVYSPCDGTIRQAVNDLPDLIPPQADPENPAGNHVAIDCGEVLVLLAHMQPGSLAVAEGDTVSAGQPIGRVGNSGNTSEPHLHLHAVQPGSADPLNGEGVPITFDGRFLVRNSTVAATP